ncbi:MAG: polysaccharide deacetylase family protein [Polyangiaceae bacterium]
MVSPARLAFWASSSGLSALAVNAAISGQPGALALSAASLSWGALVTSGVFFPWLEMYGDVVCRGPRGKNQVALTFDDGPHPDTTPLVLRSLEASRHRATFFVLACKVRKYPELARAIADAGHTLGIHGDTHDRLHSFRTPWRVRDELLRARDDIEAASGQRPTLFRPPLGHTTPATLRGARKAQVTPIGWSARGYDGIRGRSEAAVRRDVSRSLDDGAIRAVARRRRARRLRAGGRHGAAVAARRARPAFARQRRAGSLVSKLAGARRAEHELAPEAARGVLDGDAHLAVALVSVALGDLL